MSTNASILERAARHFNEPTTRDRYFDLYDRDAVLRGYAGVPPGIDGIKAFYATVWSAFPDARLELEDVIEEGDKLAARFALRATHRGEFMGVPATGRPIAITGITILRFRDGKCVERWSEANFLAMLQQIGAIPAPEASAR